MSFKPPGIPLEPSSNGYESLSISSFGATEGGIVDIKYRYTSLVEGDVFWMNISDNHLFAEAVNLRTLGETV